MRFVRLRVSVESYGDDVQPAMANGVIDVTDKPSVDIVIALRRLAVSLGKAVVVDIQEEDA